MSTLFNTQPIEKKQLQIIRNMVKKNLNKKVVSGIEICKKKKVKARKIIIKGSNPLRLDINFPENITILQKIANKTDIEIPKIIFIEGKYKYSEWIEGVMIRDVFNINEVLIKSGDLIGRLNLIKDPQNNYFLTNGEFSGSNAIWTKDRKVYIIDHGRMKSKANPDMSVIKLLLKRIQKKERINLFLEGYSKHRNTDNIIKGLEDRNWKWSPWVERGKI